VQDLLERHGLPGALLRVEVTESAVMSDPERAAQTLADVRALGVSVALDDFGTGYSSLSLLASLPVDEIKIDRDFVHRMGSDVRSEAIVRTTIELARSLELRVVAEGVETLAQWHRLTALRCHSAQGYLLGAPMPAAELEGWLHGASVLPRAA
jgi:diguanylate cyclase